MKNLNRVFSVLSAQSRNRNLEDVALARQGFGSFHSGDIEDLIKDLPNSIAEEMISKNNEIIRHWRSRLSNMELGENMRDQLFSFRKPWTFINHGAFGGVITPMADCSEFWRKQCELQPLKFFDRDLFPMVAHSLRRVAQFFNCPPTEIYPLQNVTTGLNCVFQSVNLSKDDEVVCFSLTYGSTKKMLQDLCSRSGATLRIIHVPLPINDPLSIMSSLRDTLNDKTRMVIIDQITSNTGLVLPTIELARLAKAAGALVVVDAAHAMMAAHVSLYPPSRGNSSTSTSTSTSSNYNMTSPEAKNKNDADTVASSGASARLSGRYTEPSPLAQLTLSDVADVWLTNAHKWFCGPKGGAFMWVRPSVARHLRPAVVSHGFAQYSGHANDRCDELPKLRWWHDSAHITNGQVLEGNQSRLLSALVWDGCRDYSSMLSVPIGLDVWGLMHRAGSARTDHTSGSTTSLVATEDNTRKNDETYEGMRVCRAYIRNLLHEQVVPMLQLEWGLQEADFPAPVSMRVDSPMVLVSSF